MLEMASTWLVAVSELHHHKPGTRTHLASKFTIRLNHSSASS